MKIEKIGIFDSFDIKDINTRLRAAAYTYPIGTLKRRIGFLSAAKQRRVKALMQKIDKMTNSIDDIIDYEAAKRDDPWP